ncbi:nucleotidyltransferase domain-containing protein [bacterium]|nr:nucleotidyltransferase domain-containing protein [bacterium]HDI51997.1 nucleotidyltransferase domain-containing protein [Bacteroidota bacterium]
MAKIPHQPEEIFAEFTADLKSIFQDGLLSIILFGSGARGEYVRKKSDINFLVILSEEAIQMIGLAIPLVKKWRKRAVSLPLFLTPLYVKSSLDSFPMEFLEMKTHHRLVFGEDYLAPLEIKSEHLRLQCEREVKGKLLHLRQGYLSSQGKSRILRSLLIQSLPTFATIFSALLSLKGEPIPTKKLDIFLRTAEVFDLDTEVFRIIFQMRYERRKLSKPKLQDLTNKYIEEIRKLSKMVDKL